MQNVSSLLAYLITRWTTSFAGIAIACMLVWYLGPLVPGFGQPLTRALLILAVVLAWGVVNGAISWFRRRRERRLAAGVTDGVSGGAPDGRDAKADAAEEVARLRRRMQTALRRLRGNRRRRGYLYEQPWFVLIGPPGAGKTTALMNAGLNFPAAADDGDDPSVGGVGGTRLCDWWFADEAVLIDTAGRYTTQDSDAAVDRAGWEGFLDLLRTARPRQPVNGVLVIVSITDIAAATLEERKAHARAVRRRVVEISDRLRLRVPVYVMFSKTDRLTGFNEYFADLDAEARAQVWGMTFPLAQGVESFEAEFKLLLDRLDQRLIDRLQAERAPDRRALLAGFPTQVASLAEPLADFLHHAFSGTKLDPAPFLRGVYLSSATQEGTPIDRLTGMLARSFGVDQKRTPALRPVAGRSYFLKQMVSEILLGEAQLVTTRSRWRRRAWWLRVGGYAAAAIVLVAGGIALYAIQSQNRTAVAEANAALAAYRNQLGTVKLEPVAEDDLPKVVPVLDAAAALPHGEGLWLTDVPGLSQREKLWNTTHMAYRDALQRILLPRLVFRLEAQMHERFGDPDFLYQATRVYLMLGGAGPLDRALVRSWETLDWRARFPGTLNQALRDSLARHLDALLAEPLPAVPLDDALVSAARVAFSHVPLADRVYSRVKSEATGETVPDWAPADALGTAGQPLFTRLSGKPLTDGIPGFFTADGYRKILLGHLAASARSVADESWVLGRKDEIAPQGPAVDGLEQAVIALYVAEFEKQWDGLLDDIALAPFGNRDSTVQRLYLLSSPQSPMRDLLVAVARELTLAAPPPAADTKPQSSGPLAAVVAPAAAADPHSDPHSGPTAGSAIEQHYASLRTLVGDGQDAAPLGGVLRLISRFQTDLAQSGQAGAAAAAQGGGSLQLLSAEAQRQPKPMARWLQQIVDGGRGALTGTAQAAAAAAFTANAGPAQFCQSVVTGRYPFDPTAANEAPIDDFARLFAPGGLLDAFFQAQIRPYVDMSGSTWKPQPAGGVAPPVDAASIARFQRAAAIRDAFFPNGGTEPQLRFTLAPLSLDPGATRAVVTLGNTMIPNTGHEGPATSLAWPGSDGMTTAGLAFEPAAGTPFAADGSWALFRLLDRAKVTPGAAPEAFRLDFRMGEHQASFTLKAGSARNPIGRNLLEGFRCPTVR
ncbi:type VI secretion protein IcmF [Aliidongia dinghuensis]|uniref:Type VI secretion protein IcmF n=2 Tax=Aliidongia dinghuensis TaxID=1867774 RepID=A0A8J3E722_9PROT|nr:type VI secretion protein IcmF [Aliidongia dinghuensis]